MKQKKKTYRNICTNERKHVRLRNKKLSFLTVLLFNLIILAKESFPPTRFCVVFVWQQKPHVTCSPAFVLMMAALQRGRAGKRKVAQTGGQRKATLTQRCFSLLQSGKKKAIKEKNKTRLRPHDRDQRIPSPVSPWKFSYKSCVNYC